MYMLYAQRCSSSSFPVVLLVNLCALRDNCRPCINNEYAQSSCRKHLSLFFKLNFFSRCTVLFSNRDTLNVTAILRDKVN